MRHLFTAENIRSFFPRFLVLPTLRSTSLEFSVGEFASCRLFVSYCLFLCFSISRPPQSWIIVTFYGCPVVVRQKFFVSEQRATVKPRRQTDATLFTNNSQHNCWVLHVASVFTRCCVLLGVVARSLKLVKLLSQKLPTFFLFRDHRSVAQQCWICLNSFSSIVGATHAHNMWSP